MANYLFYIFLLLASIVASFNGVLIVLADETGEQLLAEVCKTSKTKQEVPIFTSPSQVRQLIRDYERLKETTSAEFACPPKFGGAFEELGKLLTDESLLDVCSPQMYDLIRAYHTRFIHFYLPETTREQLIQQKNEAKGRGVISLLKSEANSMTEPIPESLRRFFVLFVKQITATCKQHLVSKMQEMKSQQESGEQRLLDDEDFAVIERYKKESQRLGFLYQLSRLGLSTFGRVDRANKFNELQIVDLVDARVNDSSLVEGAKLFVQVRFDDRLKRIKEACLKRFMPVYMELFAPVIKLNNLGYIERTKSSFEDKELNEDESIVRWFDIIQACEVIKDIEVLHDSSAMSAIIGIIQDNSHLNAQDGELQADLRKVKILSPSEALELQTRVQSSNDEVRPSYDPQTIHLAHQQVGFTPRMWLTTRKEVERELQYFDKDLERLLYQRTSFIKLLRNDIRMYLKNFFHTHKNEILDRDQSTALGQLTVFFERHRLVFTGISICMSIIFLTTMFAG